MATTSRQQIMNGILLLISLLLFILSDQLDLPFRTRECVVILSMLGMAVGGLAITLDWFEEGLGSGLVGSNPVRWPGIILRTICACLVIGAIRLLY